MFQLIYKCKNATIQEDQLPKLPLWQCWVALTDVCQTAAESCYLLLEILLLFILCWHYLPSKIINNRLGYM